MNGKSYVVVGGAALVLAFGSTVLAAGDGGHAGGASSSHMSQNGQSNTNAQFLPDSTRGLDRATERMSDQGLAHEKATDHAKQGAVKKTKTKPDQVTTK